MSVAAAATLEETKAYLRIEDGSEDATLARLIAVASGLGEQFTGQVFVARDLVQAVPACARWQRLAAGPVRAIGQVAALAVDGTTAALPPAAYAIDVDGDGAGWVRVAAGGAARASVTYRAGLAETAADLPEPLRQGAIRLTAHLFAHRDEAGEGAPPAVVAALWRPWRRLSLGGAGPAGFGR